MIFPLLVDRDKQSKTKFSSQFTKKYTQKTRIFWPSVLTEPRPCEHGGGLPLHLLCPLLLLDEHLIPPDSVLVVGGEAGEDKVEDRGRTGEGAHTGDRGQGTGRTLGI